MKKRDDANQMARRIMSKDCNRGQSAMWRRVGNRSSIWRSIHRNQCETEPGGEGLENVKVEGVDESGGGHTLRNARFTGFSAISTLRMTSKSDGSPAMRLFPVGQ